jgi:hypothetical protein
LFIAFLPDCLKRASRFVFTEPPESPLDVPLECLARRRRHHSDTPLHKHIPHPENFRQLNNELVNVSGERCKENRHGSSPGAGIANCA